MTDSLLATLSRSVVKMDVFASPAVGKVQDVIVPNVSKRPFSYL
jgi:hypothetical protein